MAVGGKWTPTLRITGHQFTEYLSMDPLGDPGTCKRCPKAGGPVLVELDGAVTGRDCGECELCCRGAGDHGSSLCGDLYKLNHHPGLSGAFASRKA